MKGTGFRIGYRNDTYCQGNLVQGSGLEGQQPASHEQGEKKEKAENLEQERVAQAVERFASQNVSGKQSGEQSEKVGPNVCMLTRTSQ